MNWCVVITRHIIAMNQGKYVFAQIMEHLSRTDFEACVKKYQSEKYVKSFSSHDQLLAMIFGQLSYRESLRDVVACLSAHKQKLYHIGFRSSVSLPTLAHANEKRDWRVYRKLAEILIEKTRTLYVGDPNIASDIEGACYAIDSTSIELCLNLFRWALCFYKGGGQASSRYGFARLYSCIFRYDERKSK